MGNGSWQAGDELRLITAMFVDVIGSTALGERLPPDEVKTLIGECVTRICEVIEGHGGTVGAYMGDGIAAFFGMPVAHEDDAERAARAALVAVEVVEGYAREIERDWGLGGFGIRVGINTGTVAVGPVGSSQPQEIALGDAVNVAARLESLAPPGAIVIGAAAATALRDRFLLEALGPLEIKGRAEAVPAWRLLDEVATAVVTPGRVVGREAELRRLDSVAANLAEGRGGIVVINGEPGIGKSTLLAKLRELTDGQVLWLQGRCAAQDWDLPYKPFREMLAGWLGVGRRDPALAVRLRLARRLEELFGSPGDELLPYLGKMLALELEPRHERRLADLHPGEVAARQRAAYLTWVRRLAQDRAAVVAVDDADRADPWSCALAEELLGLTEAARVLVALGLRPEADSPGWGVRMWAQAHHAHRTVDIALEPLSAEVSRELLAGLDLAESLPRGECDRIVRLAEGNPLHLEELARAALDPGSDDTAGGSGGTHRFPPALRSLFLARVDRLPASARELIQVAAVAGRTFPRRLLEEATRRADLEDDLGKLVRADFVRESHRPPDAEYSFKHVLLQEAILSTLTPSRRRALHRRIAEAILSAYGPQREDWLDALAHHYGESDAQGKAIGYLERAAEEAVRAHSVGHAIDLLTKARGVAETLADAAAERRTTEQIALLWARMGELGRAAEELDSLVTKVPQADRARALLLRAQVFFEAGEFGEATSAIERAEAAGPDGASRAGLTCLAGRVAFRQNRYEAVRTRLEEMDAMPPECFSVELDFQRSRLWVGYSLEVGDLDRTRVWAEKSLRLALIEEDPTRTFEAKRDLSLVELVGGNVPGAHLMLRSAHQSAKDMGLAVGVMGTGANLLCTHLLLGSLQEGARLGHELLEDVKVPYWRTAILINLGALEFELDRLVEARTLFAEALELSGGDDDSARDSIEAGIRLAAVDVAEGRLERATESLLRQSRSARELEGRFDVEVLALLWLAEAALRAGDPEQAHRRALAAATAATRAEKTDRVAPLRLVGVAADTLEPGSGRQALERALGLARSLGMRLEEGRLLAALGQAAPPGAQRRVLERQAELTLQSCDARRELRELSAPEPRSGAGHLPAAR